jgi:CTP synthase
MPDQKKLLLKENMAPACGLERTRGLLKRALLLDEAYGKDRISERHRHRYEVNPKYVKRIENAGLVFSGRSPGGVLMEIAELPREMHPFFLGTQFHPEFKARPLHPHPLFQHLLKPHSSAQNHTNKSKSDFIKNTY